MSELHVVATIPARADAVDEIRAALASLAEATRQEDGCLAYDFFESGAAPGLFISIERWRGQADLDAHLASPHVAAAFAAADGLLAGEVAIHPLIPLS